MKIKHLPFVAGMASLALILGAYSFEHIGGL
ncbi:MAG: disulfide bond formation protein B, partial [Rhodobacterales bacterium]|nr:disulfide bond formation protein B [Rhodobacterales bacterium]